jgi:hypothetical protein
MFTSILSDGAAVDPVEAVMLEVIVFVVDSALQLLMWLREQCRDIPEQWADRPAEEG